LVTYKANRKNGAGTRDICVCGKPTHHERGEESQYLGPALLSWSIPYIPLDTLFIPISLELSGGFLVSYRLESKVAGETSCLSCPLYCQNLVLPPRSQLHPFSYRSSRPFRNSANRPSVRFDQEPKLRHTIDHKLRERLRAQSAPHSPYPHTTTLPAEHPCHPRTPSASVSSCSRILVRQRPDRRERGRRELQ
jgi:hypothetical protein